VLPPCGIKHGLGLAEIEPVAAMALPGAISRNAKEATIIVVACNAFSERSRVDMRPVTPKRDYVK